jgi:hypothetical protein
MVQEQTTSAHKRSDRKGTMLLFQVKHSSTHADMKFAHFIFGIKVEF